MDFLSPAKLMVIAVVALAVLGPDKLPALAKQVSSLWRDFSRFRMKLESDVRGSFPDLPSTERITQAVRSPLAFLDTLADSPAPVDGTATATLVVSEETPGADDHAPEGVAEFDPSTDAHWPGETVTASAILAVEPPALVPASGGVVHEVRADGVGLDDVPSSN